MENICNIALKIPQYPKICWESWRDWINEDSTAYICKFMQIGGENYN